MVRYKLLMIGRGRDKERAVLPTILFATSSEIGSGVRVRASALTIGWWAWGVGIMRTTVRKQDKSQRR